MTVIEYCTEEVRRQGHDVTQVDGLERVGWMLEAWCYALTQWENAKQQRRPARPVISDVNRIGRLIEPNKNFNGTRRVGVRVGDRICPPASEVETRLKRLFTYGEELSPLEFYRAFEAVRVKTVYAHRVHRGTFAR